MTETIFILTFSVIAAVVILFVVALRMSNKRFKERSEDRKNILEQIFREHKNGK